jgi:hypothetical protein
MQEHPETGPEDEIRWARAFVERVVRACPRRAATSEDEARAHAMIDAEMQAAGLATEQQSFTWNESLYEVLALHFGLGALGSLAALRSPLLGFALHAGAAASYLADSRRKAFVLRRLFPFRRSQNVLGTLPAASGEPRLRVVFLAHADAAFTGFVFRPEVAASATKGPGFMKKPLRVSVMALAALAALDVAEIVGGRSRRSGLSRFSSLARAALTIPPLIAAALNLDVSLRRHVVPGAMDDLSGVATLLLLARRLRAKKPDDVELVFVATGCEEAGLGGAQALLERNSSRWERERTVVVGVDSPANGELRYYLEGEILPVPLAPWLRDALERVSSSEPRFDGVRAFPIPVGGTDAIPFAVAGYPAVSLGCVDEKTGTPRHYHLPTDTPEAMEAEMIPFCLDYVERLFQEISARKSG